MRVMSGIVQECLIHNAKTGDLVRTKNANLAFHSMQDEELPFQRIGILLKITRMGCEVWHPDPGEILIYQPSEVELIEA